MTDLHGTRIAITGGTGSFGKTMVKALLDEGVDQINILSRDEAKQDEMRHAMADPRLRFFLGDIRDRDSVDNAFIGVDYAFHAAALKQVPSCEFFPDQAVKTNVTGSHNVIQAAHDAGVRSLVCLSTDKAVYPVNAMGMSKALMEKTAQAFARNNPDSPTTVSITRYGNVMYSRGSVIPLFVKQLREGKPLSITEPAMTRFLMSLEESVDLVKHAFFHAEPGDLFVKKAPACTVGTLARAVAVVFDRPEHEIRKIGIRHGEKMYETLLSGEEMRKATDQGDYYRVPLDARNLDYTKYVDDGDDLPVLEEEFDSNTAEQMDVEQTAELVRSLPEVQEILANGGI
ncbi:polysaccharide biosynthesis protein [Kytococcus sedentarius]|uniref:UDP-glucose 4-epimerase n=1 Tax=Kytococcus sedentarius (strain ATCC 14392 / DSM 20547 / JCM 11482 / CCUG 33030 / NBRC 15357 / NCTC 11040 / CCM 314 / 541) TaxID=478801 RepID=C7NJT2_KYTSD|nr:polysaccharide biosynthesis protein [Kytococcus sedentarius]ACV06864.1 predicted nucleoside-diphosphate sugar epimerase [Kytococcus sedentarius DSM 20547]QQB62882.1 polysaccharide biosynthesis protein [Kytococcus sedentarius]STX14311.1 UDP-glucose 4-epimerase [Kytococcus sedentarius]